LAVSSGQPTAVLTPDSSPSSQSTPSSPHKGPPGCPSIEITLVPVLFRDPKRPRQIHVRDSVLPVAHFRFLHVRKCCTRGRTSPQIPRYAYSSSTPPAYSQNPAQRMKPRAVHLLNRLHQEDEVFADGIVILQIDPTFFAAPIFPPRAQAFDRSAPGPGFESFAAEGSSQLGYRSPPRSIHCLLNATARPAPRHPRVRTVSPSTAMSRSPRPPSPPPRAAPRITPSQRRNARSRLLFLS